MTLLLSLLGLSGFYLLVLSEYQKKVKYIKFLYMCYSDAIVQVNSYDLICDFESYKYLENLKNPYLIAWKYLYKEVQIYDCVNSLNLYDISVIKLQESLKIIKGDYNEKSESKSNVN